MKSIVPLTNTSLEVTLQLGVIVISDSISPSCILGENVTMSGIILVKSKIRYAKIQQATEC